MKDGAHELTQEGVRSALAKAAIGASLLGSPHMADGGQSPAPSSSQTQYGSVYRELIDNLITHEGTKEYQKAKGMYRGGKFYPYDDSLGHPTVGYGHKILKGENFDDGITEEQARQLLYQDAKTAWGDAHRLMRERNVTPNDTLKSVLSNMCFQMGIPGVRKFDKMWRYLSDNPDRELGKTRRGPDYEKAADEMIDSKWWRKDSRNRADELQLIVRKLAR